MRICILSKDNSPIGFMDNELPRALHFYDDKLHVYLKGTAHTFEFTVRADHEDAQLIEVGNKIAFYYKGRPYYLNIVNTEHDETEIRAEAWAFALELLNETAKAYSATSAMSFEEYVKAMIYSSKDMLEIGVNEVSDKRITNEWTGTTDTLLKRLYSLADVFDAELEFIPRLNDDYSLDTVLMNVYKEYSDSNQGVGERRTDANYRYGSEITGITKKQDITNLYTCIRPTGSEDLTIKNVADKTYKNDDGEVEYFHKKGSGLIYAPIACQLFPSTVSGEDKYICYNWTTDYKDENTLFGNALAKLKELCIPESTYEIKGSIDVNIGDTITVIDESFTPKLYLETRVTEQEISFTDPAKDSTTFENTKELDSKIDDELTRRVEALAKEQAATAAAATEAGTKAETASGKADTAQETAGEAKEAAASAATAAEAANETAEAAQSTAETANTAAAEAKTTATTANATANEAKTQAAAAKAAADELETLIRETDEGVEVAKIDTDGGYVGMRTEQTADAYLIKDTEGTILASYGADSVEIGNKGKKATLSLNNGQAIMEIKKNATYNTEESKYHFDDSFVRISSGDDGLFDNLAGIVLDGEAKEKDADEEPKVMLVACHHNLSGEIPQNRNAALIKLRAKDNGTIDVDTSIEFIAKSLRFTNDGIWFDAAEKIYGQGTDSYDIEISMEDLKTILESVTVTNGLLSIPTIEDETQETQPVNIETLKAFIADSVEWKTLTNSKTCGSANYIELPTSGWNELMVIAKYHPSAGATGGYDYAQATIPYPQFTYARDNYGTGTQVILAGGILNPTSYTTKGHMFASIRFAKVDDVWRLWVHDVENNGSNVTASAQWSAYYR